MSRKTKNKKTYKKRSTFAFNKSPVSTKMFTKLRYVEPLSLNPGLSGTAATHVYCANGAADPNVTTGGHQPRGFDQLMLLYDHYVVLGAKITVDFAPQTQTVPVICGINLKDDSSIYTNPNDYQEAGYCTTKIMGASQASNGCKLTMNFSTKRFLGRSNVLSDPDLKGTSGLNPTEQAYFHVWAAALDGSTDLNPMFTTVRIDYLVALIEPQQPSQS